MQPGTIFHKLSFKCRRKYSVGSLINPIEKGDL